MKKSLLIFSILAIFAVTGCKGGNSGGGSSGGGSSGGSSGEEEKVNEIKVAIENTNSYNGAYTSSLRSVMGTEVESDFNSYNPETHEFVRKTDNKNSYVIVPGENNLAKYYYMNSADSSQNQFTQCSISFADYRGKYGMMDEEIMEMGTSAFIGISEASIKGQGTDVVKKFLLFEMNDEMLSEMGVQAKLEDTTDKFDYGLEEGVKVASYTLNTIGRAGEGEYPKMDVGFAFTLKYTDKIVELRQTLDMDYHMDADVHMASSMIMTCKIDYKFDQETYDAVKTATSGITKEGVAEYNRAVYVFNGSLREEYSSKFAPNENITLEKVLAPLQSNHPGYLTNCDVQVYVDEACTKPFVERLSTNYEEVFYVKMTPKAGFTLVKEVYNDTTSKGVLSLTDEEFAFYKSIITIDREQDIKLFVASTSVNYNVIYNYYSAKSHILNMTFDGEPFNSNVISAEALASKAEHELVFNTESGYGESGNKKKPVLLSSVLINNGDDGILFSGPVNQYDNYYKINTADYKKASPNFLATAYQVDHLLAKGESLPDTATKVTSGITIEYYIDGSKVANIPADYNGEFLIFVDSTDAISFLYIQLS